jgi:hypothetical protein
MKQFIGWFFLGGLFFVIGVGLGLGIAWGIMPVRLVDTSPGTMRQMDKDQYRLLIAEDYLVTGDLDRAKARLELLDADGQKVAVIDQINRKVWKNEGEQIALTTLQSALTKNLSDHTQPTSITSAKMLEVNAGTATMPMFAAAQSSTVNPVKTLTLFTTITPRVFKILSRTPVCETDQNQPLLKIIIVDNSGKPLNGIVIIVNSPESTERIITGLKPENPAGFADYLMDAGVAYSLKIEGAGGVTETFTTAECTSPNGETFAGGWLVQIQY